MEVPLLVFGAALLGGATSWLVKWSERQLHVALALSTGTFLGAVFLHLLPEVAGRDTAIRMGSAELHASEPQTEAGASHDHAGLDDHTDVGDHAEIGDHTAVADHAGLASDHGIEAAHAHGDPFLWLCVLAGVLLVHLVEAVFLRTTEREEVSRHKSVSLVTMAGVSVHAASAGLGLSALQAGGALGTSFVVAFLIHKAFESFAMVTVFLLAHLTRPKIGALLLVFALVTPACMLAGTPLFAHFGPDVLDIVTALAAGTFLYVSVAELLPEVFHHREDNLAKFLFLAAGIGISMVLVRYGA